MSLEEAGELSRSKKQFILDSAHFFPLDTMVEDAEVLLREVERIEEQMWVGWTGVRTCC